MLVTRIYHNIRSPHRPRHPQRRLPPKTMKSTAYPAKTVQNRADEFCGRE